MEPRGLLQAVVRLLPDRLRQSPENPIQHDRLPPTTAAIEIDYPVVERTPAEATEATKWLLFAAATVPGALSLLGAWFPDFRATVALLALITAAVFAAYWFVAPFSVGRALVAAVAAGLAAFVAANLMHRLYYAALLSLVVIQVVFASHLAMAYLYLRTAAPFDKTRAREIRARWSRRWQPLLAPIPGLELWLPAQALFAAAFLLPFVVFAVEPTRVFETAVIYLLSTACLVAGICLQRVMVRNLFGRPLPPISEQWQALRRSVAEWWTYNSRESQAPGVHQGPAGSCRARRGIVVALLLAWAALWVACAARQKEQPADSLTAVHEYNTTDDIFGPPVQTSPASSTPADVAPPSPPLPGSDSFLASIAYWLAATAVTLVTPAVMTLLAATTWLLAASGPAVAGVEQLCGKARRSRALGTGGWEQIVSDLRHSDDEIEKESVFLGTNAHDDTPVIVPRRVFREHAHLLGDTGSGKTTLGILPLLTQLMRFGDASIIVLDLKADDQLFLESLRQEADRLARERKINYPCRWFTTVLGRSSYVFNPLTQRVMATLSPDQRTDSLTAALGLQYGTDYGRKYYGDANYDVLNFAIRSSSKLECFADLEEALLRAELISPLPKKVRESATHVSSSVRRLARILPLNACSKIRTPQAALDAAIDLGDVFCRPQSLYVGLPPAAGISSTAEIARLFLYSLMDAAQAHPSSEPRVQVYLFIDEFQRIVSHNIELFLQQARSMNIGCILANQSLADLDQIGADLIPAVQTNTRFRQIFGAGHRDDIRTIIDTSGETVSGHRTWQFRQGTFEPELDRLTVSEQRGPRLSINDILLMTDAPGRSIAYIRRGDGYAQYGGMPFVMDSVYHISETEYKDRRREPWPAASESTVVARLDSTTTPPPPVILDDVSQNPPSTPHVKTAPTPFRPQPAPQDSGDEESDSGEPDDDIDRRYELQQEDHDRWRRRVLRRRSEPE